MSALIEVENLKKQYPDGTQALRGVSLSITKGEFIAIMGPSGSGKSTLLHIIGFLDNQTDGLFRFDGKLNTDYLPHEVAKLRNSRVGFVFQMFNLLPRTTVLDNVLLPLLYSDIPEKEWRPRATKAIESVGLSHRMTHENSELSGGERQRVAIARALVNQPEIIFADEPTGNLDSKSGQGVMKILENLNDEGHTVVLITHETYTAEHAERIIRLHDGTIAEDGSVKKRRRANDSFVK
mgnify:FL=1